MNSKNKKPQNTSERAHTGIVKSLPCSVCDAAPPTECHEIKQGQWFTGIALCPDCHRGSRNGLHGEKIMWRLKKMDEIDALAVTIERAYG